MAVVDVGLTVDVGLVAEQVSELVLDVILGAWTGKVEGSAGPR